MSEGNHPFKTVVIDTIDNAYKFCTDYESCLMQDEPEGEVCF